MNASDINMPPNGTNQSKEKNNGLDGILIPASVLLSMDTQQHYNSM
jgi:hypothetical protein